MVVVGSGASAVHFALTALEKGRDVLMLDVGRRRPEPVMPEASWAQLKDRLADPVCILATDSNRSSCPAVEAIFTVSRQARCMSSRVCRSLVT